MNEIPNLVKHLLFLLLVTNSCSTKTNNTILLLLGWELICRLWWLLREIHKLCQSHSRTSKNAGCLLYWLPELQANLVSPRKGEFLERSWLSQQTKHWLIALLFVGSVTVFVPHFAFVSHSQVYYLSLCPKDGGWRGKTKEGGGITTENMEAAVSRWIPWLRCEGAPRLWS